MTNIFVALRQLEEERAHLSAQLEKINKAIGALNNGRVVGKRRISAAAIARIRAAQKTRWDKWRKAQKAAQLRRAKKQR